MLLGILFTAPVALSLLTCWLTDGFDSLAWLWALPVGYLGYFVLLGLMVFLGLMVMVWLVDLEKPQEQDSKPYRIAINLLAPAAVRILSLKVHTKGLEKTPKGGRFMLVCNHLSLMDPMVLLAYFRKSQLTFISKKENNDMFVVGKMMHKIQCQLIDRENDREALKTIIKCIQIVRDDKASLAVFPEGYINADKKLHHFRSGVFKIAQKTKVPIAVCTLRNTQHAFHNGFRLKKTDVDLHLVDVISPEAYEALSTVELGNLVYEMMAQDLGPENVSAEEIIGG